MGFAQTNICPIIVLWLTVSFSFVFDCWLVYTAYSRLYIYTNIYSAHTIYRLECSQVPFDDVTFSDNRSLWDFCITCLLTRYCWIFWIGPFNNLCNFLSLFYLKQVILVKKITQTLHLYYNTDNVPNVLEYVAPGE